MAGLVWVSITNVRGDARYHTQQDCMARYTTRRIPTLERFARRADVPPCTRCIGRAARERLQAELEAALDGA